MRLKKRWVAGVMIVLVMVGAMQAATLRPSVVRGQAGDENSDAPYLYYFSGRTHAWVIERADGTDRRLFGYGVIPPELNAADQVQWSPLGNWLSWYGYNNCKLPGSYVGCITDRQWQILGTGTKSRLDSLINRSIQYLKWSPTEDTFLVKEVLEYNTPTRTCPDETPCPVLHARYSLIDATSDRELWVFDRSFEAHVYGLSSGLWLNDGQTVVFSYVVGNYDSNRYSIIVIGRDGQRIERTLLADWVVISPNGMAVYPRGTDLWLMDLKTGQIQTVPSLDLQIQPYKMQWTPSGDGSLIEIPIEVNSRYAYSDLWWLDMQKGQLSFIATHVTRFLASSSLRFVYFIDNQNRLYYFDTIHRQAILLIEIDEGVGLKWVAGNQLQLWYSDYQNNQSSGFIENLETGTITSFRVNLTIGGCTDTPRLSPDGRYWAWIDGSPGVYDSQTGEQITLSGDARAFMSVPGKDVKWHPQAAWFLTFDAGLVAGGGCGSIYPGVASSDGTARRDIYSKHVDWLPDLINPEIFPLDSAPPLPRPVMTLKGTDYSMILDWSPDGKYLVADNNGWWITDIRQTMNLWDVASGRLIAQVGSYNQEYIFSDSIREFEWKYLPSGVYVPIELKETPPIPLPGWMSPEIRAISPDGKFWLIVEGWETTSIFNRKSSRIEITLPDNHYLTSGKFSPDGHLFASTSYSLHTLRIWDTKTWRILFETEIAALSLDFSPDGEYLAVGVSWDVEIWRVSDLIGKTVPTPGPSPTH